MKNLENQNNTTPIKYGIKSLKVFKFIWLIISIISFLFTLIALPATLLFLPVFLLAVYNYKLQKHNIELQQNETDYDSSNNSNLAEQLFNTQTLGKVIDNKYLYQINAILKECTPPDSKFPERQQVLLKIIDLIGEPSTPKERFIVAKAYAWSRADYRKKSIHYLEMYLHNELYYGAMRDNTPESLQSHLSEMNDYLAKAYIGEYDFEKALNIYQNMIKQFPNDVPSYIGKCEVLIKQNKLDECHKWLTESKKLPYYKLNKNYGETEPENWFYFTINRLLKDVNDKINKGYKYRPRKKVSTD